MQLCFFEDEHCDHFKPLTLTRPTGNLRTGILTIAEKWRLALGSTRCFFCTRPALHEVFSTNQIDEKEPCLWVNSRFLPSKKLLERVSGLETGSYLNSENSVAAGKVSGKQSAKWFSEGKPAFHSLKASASVSTPALKRLWDLFLMNADEICADIKRLKYPHSAQADISDKAILQNEDNMFIGKGAEVQAGAILSADDGPIYIGKKAVISAGAIVEGPAAICEKSVIKPGAKIHSNTTIGPVCKAGGEISDSVFHSYSNKGHDGYAGNTLLGQWCNLGAGTDTSNLKNNYSNVRVTDWHSRETLETGQQFLGTIMGDHSKTAIGTRMNTGTVCGVSCNIFSADFPPKFIPSFSWVGSEKIQVYKLEKALETMEAMMARRDVEVTGDYKHLMRTIFKEEQKVRSEK